MRLDQAVAGRFPEISRRKARELIAEKRVFVNDRPTGVASREVSERDRITIAEDVPDLVIVRETADWVAVNKPAGIPTQPARDRKQRSLEELLRMRYGTIFLIHRIDTPTSGVVVFAKTKKAAAELSQLFVARSIRKTYLALVEGAIDSARGIDTPIEEKSALTEIRPIRRVGEDETLVECDILTGRTHQIRIHLESIGHPVVGDRRYGSTRGGLRLMLHAWKLDHPLFDGELIAPPPPDFPPLAS
jgi:23S rRNA pseudouridine1911/1915/1917 synthase